MVSKADQRRKKKEKDRRRRKELGMQKETLKRQYTPELKKQGVRNIIILIGLSLISAGAIIYFVDRL